MLVDLPIVLLGIGVFIDVYVLSSKGDLGERGYMVMTGFCALVLGLAFALVAAYFGDIALAAALDTGIAVAPLQEHKKLALVALTIFGALTLAQGFFLWHQHELKYGIKWVLVGVALFGFLVLLSTAYHGGNLVHELHVNMCGVSF